MSVRRALAPLFLATLLATLLATPALAVTGKVVDPDRAPIAGADICYLAPGGGTLFCARSDESGRFELPESEQKRIRVTARDYVYRDLPVEELAQPIVLVLAARLLVHLRDAASGANLADGQVWIVSASGRRHGPLPCGAGGVRVSSVAPGPAEVFAKAEGYAESEPVPLTLTSGQESEVVVELTPDPK